LVDRARLSFVATVADCLTVSCSADTKHPGDALDRRKAAVESHLPPMYKSVSGHTADRRHQCTAVAIWNCRRTLSSSKPSPSTVIGTSSMQKHSIESLSSSSQQIRINRRSAHGQVSGRVAYCRRVRRCCSGTAPLTPEELRSLPPAIAASPPRRSCRGTRRARRSPGERAARLHAPRARRDADRRQAAQNPSRW
jgi:hypothetical protein